MNSFLLPLKNWKKEGKHEAAKNFKLTCNNNYESSPDILKKIETINNNDWKQNLTSIEALSTFIELDILAKKYKI